MSCVGRSMTFMLLLLSSGCITRIVTVRSNPAGALVYLNDEEVGRTPVSREFQWYGIYDVVLRKDGYQTLKTHAEVSAPLWQWIPLDLFTDMLPVTYERVVSFNLIPQVPADPAEVLANGEQMRGMLQSSARTKTRIPRSAGSGQAATHPTTQTTKPAK
jgi:hypothetical protein